MPRLTFEKELASLRESLVRMGTLVESQIESALDALRRRDGAAAEKVRNQDQYLNELFRTIREQVFMVISTQQPVARDLRFLLSVLRVTPELERSHDLVMQVADRAGSIETELGRPVDAGAVLAHVLARLNGVLSEIEHAGPPTLFTRWLELAPSATGERIEWDGPGGVQSGVSAGLAEDGALLVRTSEGLERILAGEIRWM